MITIGLQRSKAPGEMFMRAGLGCQSKVSDCESCVLENGFSMTFVIQMVALVVRNAVSNKWDPCYPNFLHKIQFT